MSLETVFITFAPLAPTKPHTPSLNSDARAADPLTRPEQLDFSDEHAVREAHARFAQAPALNDWCERSFNATDRARIRDAFATLMLCQYASERQQRANAIPGTGPTP